MGGTVGIVSRLAVLLAGAYAMFLLLAAPPPSELAVERRHASASDRRWSVRVDGWQIEVDDVRRPEEDRQNYGSAEESFSPYDDLIVRYAKQADLDWRLVSAVIFEESRFQPDVESAAGAFGLMQVRALAATQIGESDFHEPEANIRAGTRYLQYLHGLFDGAADRDRLALALAAYNMGPSHVQDAQSLAREFGLNPLRWDGSAEVMVELLEQPAVCQRLANGCAFGKLAVDYVGRVLDRYATYRRYRPEVPAGWPLHVVIGGREAEPTAFNARP